VRTRANLQRRLVHRRQRDWGSLHFILIVRERVLYGRRVLQQQLQR
jgi:hypothetical protein